MTNVTRSGDEICSAISHIQLARAVVFIGVYSAMPLKPWKTVTTRDIYQNKWISVREDIAEMPESLSAG